MELLHPGVYVQEVPSGVQPIEGVSTSTAAFIGKAEMGPMNSAVMVTSMPEFTALYGNFLTDGSGFLAQSVLEFFNNGGRRTYVVRIAGSGAATAAITIRDRKSANPANALAISAKNEGNWGNLLDIVITDGTSDPGNLFNIAVFRNRSNLNPPLPALLLETIEDVSMDPGAANFVDRVTASARYISTARNAANAATATAGVSRGGRLAIGNGADLLLLGTANGGTETPGATGPATAGTSQSGTSPATNPPADKRRLVINLDGDGPRDITLPADAATGAAIAAAIQAAVRALTAVTAAHQPAYDNFTATFQTPPQPALPFYLLTSGTKGAASSAVVSNSVATPIKLPAGPATFTINVNGDGPQQVLITGPLADGAAIAAAITTAVQALLPHRAANANAYLNFAASYDTTARLGNPSFVLTSGVANGSSAVAITNGANNNVATLLNLGLTNGGTEINGSAVLRPATSQTPTEYHMGLGVVTGNVAAVAPGADGSTPIDQDYTGGLVALDIVQDVNLVAIPGIGSQGVVAFGTNYCTQRADCFFIGDMALSDDTKEEAISFVNGLTVKSSYGAVYYPWLRIADPSGLSTGPIPVPPSGFVAGMYARTDATRGVWKAPAGTSANVGGAVGLVASTTDAQQDVLNPIGVNVIRAFPASGIVIWGARTLATRSNPEYRYIPVRRTAIFLERSIYGGIQYAVFEPNDEPLWSSLRLNVSAFMMLQFRAGAFQGGTATDAFFVKVDATTTTQADIDAGIVNILVGFAPLKPAEFVVLKLTQKVNKPA
jgi:phage tail sheath protein FI